MIQHHEYDSTGAAWSRGRAVVRRGQVVLRRWSAAVCAGALLLALSATMLHAQPAAQDGVDAADVAPDPIAILADREADLAARQQSLAAVLTQGDRDHINRLAQLLVAQPHDATLIRMTTATLAAAPEAPHPGLRDAMRTLLFTVDEPLVGDLPVLVSRSADATYTKDLLAVAADGDIATPARVRVVRALAYVQEQHVAGGLVELLAPNQPAELRGAAGDALSQLTGLADMGSSYAAWSAWWESHKDLSRGKWRDALLRNFTIQSRRMAAQQRQLQQRWIAAQAQLYRATPEQDRPDMLITMMNDRSSPASRHAMRHLALDLMEQRLIDRRPFPAPLREALHAALDDPVPAIRAGVADRLRALSDDAGAKAIAARLTRNVESHPVVLSSYLRFVSDKPQASVVSALMELLSRTEVRGDAAGALVSAIDAELVDVDDLARIKTLLGEIVSNDEPPAPKVVELLGRVGANGDWARIARWLRDDDPAIRTAAARAWARSDLSLAPLAARVDDPLLQPIAIHAAATRGYRAETLRALSSHPPEQLQAREQWQLALVRMSARAPVGAVIEVVMQLRENSDFADLCEQMLSSARSALLPRANGNGGATRPTTTGPDRSTAAPASEHPPTWELTDEQELYLVAITLARADVSLGAGKPALALADIQYLREKKLPMTDTQQRRVGHLEVQSHLAAGEVDKAFDAASLLRDPVADETAVRSMLGAFLDAAERSVASNKVDVAVTILDRLGAIEGLAASGEQMDRGRRIRARATAIAAASTTAEAGTAASSDNAVDDAGESSDDNAASMPNSDGGTSVTP